MDRDEALKLLNGGEEGIRVWNQRHRAGEAIPDLNSADLSGANLSDANLRHANLRHADISLANLIAADLIDANLRDADLSHADLSHADLRGAKLSNADLSGANLHHANLRYANLSHADISHAGLSNADLRGANLNSADLNSANLNSTNLNSADLRLANLNSADLNSADLSGANLIEAEFNRGSCSGTLFANVDLSKAQWLESINHFGPSTVGIDTLFLSEGKIPETFLRGCGVPETLIAYLPSILGAMQPIQFYSCFISYSTKNQDFAERLHSKMRDKGLRVWYSPEDIQGGKKLHEQIDEAIRLYDKLLLVLSPESMNSEWVKTEIRKARKAEIKEGKRKLFPIRLVDFNTIQEWECFDADSGKDLGVEIREFFIPDFSNWKEHDSFEAGFARLLNDLKAKESTGAKPG